MEIVIEKEELSLALNRFKPMAGNILGILGGTVLQVSKGTTKDEIVFNGAMPRIAGVAKAGLDLLNRVSPIIPTIPTLPSGLDLTSSGLSVKLSEVIPSQISRKFDIQINEANYRNNAIHLDLAVTGKH